MRIAIDARLNAYRRGGIPQYTRFLLTSMAEIAREDQFISLQHRDMLRPLAVAQNVTRRTVYTPPHHRLEQWSLPVEVTLARPHVFHTPDFIAPVRRPFPAVATIHDLAFMHYPDILDDAARAYYGQVKTSSHRADSIIAVSEATRQDIVQFLDLSPEQIHVIYEAAAPVFRPIDLRISEARVLNGTPVAAGSFMLFVSTLEPRKNIPTLLRALRICLDRQPSRPYFLIIAGGRGWRDDGIFSAVRDLRLADHVLFAGNVGQYDLRWLYNACQFYINPSLYEGFGLPLLEAMACGAACLASATSSLPEIGGDAVIYVPPLDVEMWADSIEALWDNTEQQDELSRLGRARSQRFSWVRAARETLRVYQHAVSVADEGGVAKQTKPVSPPPRSSLPYAGPGAIIPYPSISEEFTPYFNGDTPIRIGMPSQHQPIRIFTHARNEARPAGTNLAIERTFIATESPKLITPKHNKTSDETTTLVDTPEQSQDETTLLVGKNPLPEAENELSDITPSSIETPVQDMARAGSARRLAVLREAQQVVPEPTTQTPPPMHNNNHKTRYRRTFHLPKSYRHKRNNHAYKFVTAKSHTVAKRRWRNKRKRVS
ncbi:MAG: glycosyltransferase family 1 protein [Chloroflexota bacterium]